MTHNIDMLRLWASVVEVTMTSYGTPDNLEEGENEKLCPTCEGMGVTPVICYNILYELLFYTTL